MNSHNNGVDVSSMTDAKILKLIDAILREIANRPSWGAAMVNIETPDQQILAAMIDPANTVKILLATMHEKREMAVTISMAVEMYKSRLEPAERDAFNFAIELTREFMKMQNDANDE